mgnify:CR=1 FL=1
MEKELLNYNLLDELEKMYYSSLYTSDVEIKSFIKNLLIDINNILNNYETLKDEEFIRILNRFIRVKTDEEMCEKTICDFWSPTGGYEYHTELYYDDIVNNENVITENEMIDLYNRVNNTNYKYLTSLKTKMIYNHYYCSGYGTDKDEGVVPNKVDIIILTNKIFNRKKSYTKKEIQTLIDNKDIFVISSNKMKIKYKDIPKYTEEFYEFGLNKESTEYKRAYRSFLNSKISKKELYKIIKLCIVCLKENFYKINMDNEKFKETCLYNEMEKIYTLITKF